MRPPRLILIGADRAPRLRALVRAEATRRGIACHELPAARWGADVRPWLTLADGTFAAGWIDGADAFEVTPADRVWVMAEDPLPAAEGIADTPDAREQTDYLRAEAVAAREGWHTACPGRVINRRGLCASAFIHPAWRLASMIDPNPALAPPTLAFGPRPGPDHAPWPDTRRGSERVWWRRVRGALHVALVTPDAVTLCRWTPTAIEDTVDPPPALTAALTALTRRHGAQYLEVWLAGDLPGRCTVLDVNAQPVAVERLTGAAADAADRHLTRFVADWLDP